MAAASAALLLLSWNAVDVLGTTHGSVALAGQTAGGGNGGSIDIVAPVTTRQS